jgi:uncharacterized protein with NRDE domain
MCTIIAISRVHPQYPLVVAANRDEFYDRPAAGPRLLGQAPRSVGGLDLRQKGSWLGANEHGIFAGLTNQRTFRLPDPGLRSRGEVVTRALAAASVAEIEGALGGLDPAAHNPFNLLFGDAERLCVAYARTDARRVEVEALPAGIHVLANDRLGSPAFPRAELARREADALCRRPWPELREALARLLADHRRPPLEAIEPPPAGSFFTREQLWAIQALCIHTEVYGTCSAAIVALERGRVAHYDYAPGPPCRTAFEDAVGLLYPTTG